MSLQRFAFLAAVVGLLALVMLAVGPYDPHSAAGTVTLRSIGICSADRQMGITEIAAGECGFVEVSDTRILRRGFSGEVGWLRLVVQNTAEGEELRWLHVGHSRLQAVTLYEATGDGRWRATRSGSSVPRRDKPVDTPDPVFALSLGAGAESVVYVSVDTETAMNLTPTLFVPDAYRDLTRSVQLVQAGAVGALLLTVLFALILFARLDERVYLYFALCQLAVIVMDTSYTGLLAVTLWPSTLPFDIRIQAASSAATLGLFVLFLGAFLAPPLRRTVIWRLLVAMVITMGFATAYACLVNYGEAVPVQAALGILSVLACVVLSLRMWRAGSRPAGILTVAYGVLAAMLLYRQTMAFGIFEPGLAQQVGFAWCFVLVAPTVLGGVLERSEAMRAIAAEARSEALARMRLMAQMSHELRAPLSSIAGFAHLLDSERPRTTPREAALAIEGEARRVLTMVDELLDYARGEVGQLRLQPEPVTLRDVLDALRRSAELLAADRGNRFELEINAAVPAVMELDPQRLRQVLDNLVGNAARYTSGGRIWLHCTASAPTDADRLDLTFSVADTGSGIAPDELGRIFEPFFRGRAGLRDANKGAGIGLPLSRQLVGLMGGEISVESRVGEGSRFAFTIPVRQLTPLHRPALSAGLPRPPDALLQQLRGYVALGAIGDIERWLAVLSEQPQFAAFHAAAAEAARRLDFAALNRLAAHSSVEVDGDSTDPRK